MRISDARLANPAPFLLAEIPDLIADLRDARAQQTVAELQLAKAEAALQLVLDEGRLTYRHQACTPKNCSIIAARAYFFDANARPETKREGAE